ncbi:hypothetical protein SNEBB_003996 [Seison nebaliae]|nr:hypothetical protein SNEBB_003996 [Seison nebaliae]
MSNISNYSSINRSLDYINNKQLYQSSEAQFSTTVHPKNPQLPPIDNSSININHHHQHHRNHHHKRQVNDRKLMKKMMNGKLNRNQLNDIHSMSPRHYYNGNSIQLNENRNRQFPYPSDIQTFVPSTDNRHFDNNFIDSEINGDRLRTNHAQSSYKSLHSNKTPSSTMTTSTYTKQQFHPPNHQQKFRSMNSINHQFSIEPSQSSRSSSISSSISSDQSSKYHRDPYTNNNNNNSNNANVIQELSNKFSRSQF